MQSTLEKKMVAVKAELKVMTAHWRKEWREAIIKWSEKIFISRLSVTDESVILPTDHNAHYYLVSPYLRSSESHKRSLQNAVDYRNVHANKELDVVPLNLAVLVYRHLVLAFGCEFVASPSPYEPGFYYHHFLWTGQENESNYWRHRKLIHDSSSLPQSPSLRFETSFGEFKEEFDGWEKVAVLGFQMDDKLKASKYIQGVLRKLTTHQINKIIDYHFFSRPPPILTAAKNIFNTLKAATVTANTCAIYTSGEGFNLELLYDKNNRNEMKNFNVEKCKKLAIGLENPQLLEMVNDLTMDDVIFVLSCFIDAEYDIAETIDAIKKMEELELVDTTDAINTTNTTNVATVSVFPAATDHFNNFDFPHLRGLLAETVLSRKLATYQLGLEAIRKIDADGKTTFASIAPAALVDIVTHYLPINL